MIIFLIGLPGAGKSFWAKKLSQQHQRPYADLDLYIENYTGKTIPELFAVSEKHFRQEERAALRQLLQIAAPDTIIATGGGTPAFHDNMEFIKQNGTSIYLKASAGAIVKRLISSTVDRPLLKNTTPERLKEKLHTLLAERRHFYEQADEIIELENARMANFDRILKL